MNKIKGLLMIVFLACTTIMNGFILEKSYENYLKISRDHFIDPIDQMEYVTILHFWKDYIPETYLRDIIEVSLVEGVSVDIVYAIVKIESNFRYLRSITPNRDGSIDYGLMGINSKNINSDTYMNKYFYNSKYFKNKKVTFNKWNQKHILITGVRYIKYLINKTGSLETAIMAYNGGIGNVIRNSIPTASYKYKDTFVELVRTLRYDYIIFNNSINVKSNTCVATIMQRVGSTNTRPINIYIDISLLISLYDPRSRNILSEETV